MTHDHTHINERSCIHCGARLRWRDGDEMPACWCPPTNQTEGKAQTPTFEPGERAMWIVGMPGPDIDDCEVIKRNADGTYQVRHQVYGQGPWHEDTAYPWERRIGGLFKKGKAHD